MNNRLWNIFIDRKRKLKIEKQIVAQIVYSKPPIHFYPITVMQWHGKRERCTQTRQWTHYVFKNSKNKLRTELKLTVACVISMMSSVGGCVSEVFECNIIWCSNRSQTWTNPKWVSYGGDRTSSWAPRVFLKEHSLSHVHRQDLHRKQPHKPSNRQTRWRGLSHLLCRMWRGDGVKNNDWNLFRFFYVHKS